MPVMRAAVVNNVDGIIGECGGQMMCSTCHVHVCPDRVAELPPITEEEDEMLDLAASPRDETSRLSCQLRVEDLAGREVHLPHEQL